MNACKPLCFRSWLSLVDHHISPLPTWYRGPCPFLLTSVKAGQGVKGLGTCPVPVPPHALFAFCKRFGPKSAYRFGIQGNPQHGLLDLRSLWDSALDHSVATHSVELSVPSPVCGPKDSRGSGGSRPEFQAFPCLYSWSGTGRVVPRGMLGATMICVRINKPRQCLKSHFLLAQRVPLYWVPMFAERIEIPEAPSPCELGWGDTLRTIPNGVSPVFWQGVLSPPGDCAHPTGSIQVGLPSGEGEVLPTVPGPRVCWHPT
jgi:hypothetical protein